MFVYLTFPSPQVREALLRKMLDRAATNVRVMQVMRVLCSLRVMRVYRGAGACCHRMHSMRLRCNTGDECLVRG